MIYFPNAKINLGLNVIRRRPDGYHDLLTVMVPVMWRDVLEAVPARGDSTTISVTGHRVDCPPEKNLVIKAFRALEAEVGPLPPVDFYLEKIIPDGAGLGGGSADASFALKAVNELLELGLDNERLEKIAARVGADCPFFIADRPALCTGTGTDMNPIEIPSLAGCSIAIAKRRGQSVSTAAAYAAVKPREPRFNPAEVLQMPVPEWRGRLVNDFEDGVFAALPATAALKEHFYSAGALYAAMSGSGAAVFGIFNDEDAARRSVSGLDDCDTYVGRF